MSSAVTNFSNVLPTSVGKELVMKPPSQSAPADRQTLKFPCTQGSAFSASGNGLSSVIRFQLPAVNRIIDLSAGVRFAFKASTYKDSACTQPTTQGDTTEQYFSEGISSVISRLRILTSADQLLEDIDGYGLISRILADASTPAAMKDTVLGIAQGYGSRGNRSGPNRPYLVPLHSALFSQDKWVNLKHTSGLVVEITLAAPQHCLINTTGTVGGYVVSDPYLTVDSIVPHADQLAQLDAAWQAAGGVMYTGLTWSRKNPSFVTPTGSVVIADRHAQQRALIMAFRTPQFWGKANVDPLARGQPGLTSYSIKNGDEMVTQRPIDCTFPGVEPLRELEIFTRGHVVGDAINASKWNDGGSVTGGAFNPPNGSFTIARTFETSSLVSGSEKAKKSGVDIEVLTTGQPFMVDNSLGTVAWRCDAFIGFTTAISFNIDGSVDVFN